MRIILISTHNYILKELKKSNKYKQIIVIKNYENIFEIDDFEKKFLILYHLDNDLDIDNNLKSLNENFKDSKIVGLRNNTNNIEGCSLLKKGFKGYAHSLSNINILDDIIKSVSDGNIWIYPELMQFLISSVPLKETKKNELLDSLTIKELEVLELVSQGLNNSDIANILSLSKVSIKKYISSLFKKLDQKDRLSLALFCKNYNSYN